MHPFPRLFPALFITIFSFVTSVPARAVSPSDVVQSDVPISLSKQIPSPVVPAEGWKRESITVAGTTAPPTINGKLDDPCWSKATHYAGFYRYAGNSPVVDQTELWFCADKTHLYVAFHCLDANPGAIKDSEIQENSNGIFQDDYVAFDVDSQTSRKGYSTFVVSARGTQWAQPEGGDRRQPELGGRLEGSVRAHARRLDFGNVHSVFAAALS